MFGMCGHMTMCTMSTIGISSKCKLKLAQSKKSRSKNSLTSSTYAAPVKASDYKHFMDTVQCIAHSITIFTQTK